MAGGLAGGRQPVRAHLGGLVGFYAYGGLAPVPGGDCALHNQSMTITVLRERPR